MARCPTASGAASGHDLRTTEHQLEESSSCCSGNTKKNIAIRLEAIALRLEAIITSSKDAGREEGERANQKITGWQGRDPQVTKVKKPTSLNQSIQVD